MSDQTPFSMSSPFTPAEKKLLLDAARRAIELGVTGRDPLADLPLEANLNRPGGAFVTLHLRGRLRGCIGQLPSRDPLIQAVAHCARAAALEDPRFEPVRPTDVAEIEIELSILSPLFDAAPDQIVAGKHGISVSRGSQRGVLLPQVAAQFCWDAKRFLEETCVKAELGREGWKDPGVRIQLFTAEVFGEAALRADQSGQPDLPLNAKPGYSSST